MGGDIAASPARGELDKPVPAIDENPELRALAAGG
jgi:hypothetical protein